MTTHGLSRHPLYKLWKSILRRCTNPNEQNFKYYGGRGIGMYRPWVKDAPRFIHDVLAEIGDKPSLLHSIDRIDNDLGYQPGNIRWATPEMQMSNRRSYRHKRAMAEDVAIVGQRFGYWTVLGYVRHESQDRVYSCRCDCGAARDVPRKNLLRGLSKSCGCKRGELGWKVRRAHSGLSKVVEISL